MSEGSRTEEEKIRLTEEIRAIRAKNNRNWMDLTALAQRVSPAEAAGVLGAINECDGKINAIARQFQPGEEGRLRNLDLIDELQGIRTENNKNWMDLLRIAFRSANDEAAAIMSRISELDAEVNSRTAQLKEKP